MEQRTFTQVYLPVLHSNGERYVQVTNEDGVFCGWADGAGKYDRVGTWEVCDRWYPDQAAELGRIVRDMRTYAEVMVQEDRLARRVTATF